MTTYNERLGSVEKRLEQIEIEVHNMIDEIRSYHGYVDRKMEYLVEQATSRYIPKPGEREKVLEEAIRNFNYWYTKNWPNFAESLTHEVNKLFDILAWPEEPGPPVAGVKEFKGVRWQEI